MSRIGSKRRARRETRQLALATCGALSLAGLISPRVAAAQGPRSVRIDYEAPPGCPDAKRFEAQVRARTAKVIVSADGATLVRVRIAARAPREGRFEGDVLLADAPGHEATRRVEGSCSDVASALALITALALDPTASLTAEPPPAPAPTPTPAPAPAPALAPPPAHASPPPPLRAPADESARTASRDHALRDEEARAHGWGWSIGAGAALTQGVAPSLLFSVPGFIDVWRRTDRAFAPSVRLRFERADSGATRATGPGADFTWTAGSLDLCPVAWSFSRFRVSPCVRVEAGMLSAAGTGVTPVRTDARAWLSAGVVARVRLTLVGALFLEVEGGGFAPLVRDRFFVEPDETVQRAPAVAFAGAAGIGVTFW